MGRSSIRLGRFGLSVLAVLGLLLLYGLVVRQVARQGDASRRATALTTETAWRCKALRTTRLRTECLRLTRDEPPADSASLQAQVLLVAASPPP